jgi:hypothetical protein
MPENIQSCTYLLVFRDCLRDGRANTSALEIGRILTRWIEWHDSLAAQRKMRFRGAVEPEVLRIRGSSAGQVPLIRKEEVDPIVGYLLVDAANFDEATEIARACPGLEHGFAVEVCRPFPSDLLQACCGMNTCS